MTAGDVRTMVLQTGGFLILLGLLLFGLAGTIAWPAGWAFLALYLAFALVAEAWLLRHDPGLLKERMSLFHAGQARWDRIFVVLLVAAAAVWGVVMPLDAERLRWSHVPAWLQVAGGIAVAGGELLFLLTFRENSYLSPTVRVQRERGQRVVSTGPYRYVRHPLYSGFVLWVVGAALLLGSWVGLLISLALVAGVAWRAVREERTLRTELDGYDAYLARVRFRLIPGVW